MPTFLCGKPLKFGDKEQIAAINEIEEGARKRLQGKSLSSKENLRDTALR